ncbi:MAG: cell division protein FtsX [Bacteroidetes bacterium]|uniref:Cell division protein FtsX n=1 Tax=Candidatus Cryptobacteroides excrementavium TaxID=2840759 RepID=A0A9D9NRJ6_9BACT|nr:cell division protein FtsX [Candidatus Cryptobacteroides excrementavium]
MAKGEKRAVRRRIVNAYVSSVISISLVLLLVGVASLLLVNARSVSDYFKENMQVSVMLKPDVSDEEAARFQTALENMSFIRNSEFISRERGASEMAELLGDDFLRVFDTAPIPVSIDVTLDADYVSADSLEVVKKAVSASPLVDEVVYQQSLVEALNANLSKISSVLAIFIALLLFISFVLINNTVRLSVFDRRFSIHTMKMVGATRGFIRAPFLVQALFQGLFSAILAIIMLLAILFVVRSEFVQLFEIFRMELLLSVMGIVTVCGVAICMTSTLFVVNRLISLNKDELYF